MSKDKWEVGDIARLRVEEGEFTILMVTKEHIHFKTLEGESEYFISHRPSKGGVELVKKWYEVLEEKETVIPYTHWKHQNEVQVLQHIEQSLLTLAYIRGDIKK